MNRIYTYEYVKVLKIIDGDTLDVLIDLGFNLSKEVRLRLHGINAPEIKGVTRQEGLASKEYLQYIIPVDTIIKVECMGIDKYGRYLAKIYKNNIDINNHLLVNGYVTKY